MTTPTQTTASIQIPEVSSNNVSSSIDVLTVGVLKELQILKEKVHSLENKTLLDELQLPEKDLREMGLLKNFPTRMHRGKNRIPLMESEIKDAQSHCDTAASCARYLKVGYRTYRKYAVMYGIFKTNPWGVGDKKRFWAPDKGKYPLNQILEGKFPEYSVFRLKDLLIRSGTKPPKCENCGDTEARITDGKRPLLLNFLDGNEKNHKLENIQLLCYNCTFRCGKGYIRRGKVRFYFSDPDILQGSKRKVATRF